MQILLVIINVVDVFHFPYSTTKYTIIIKLMIQGRKLISPTTAPPSAQESVSIINLSNIVVICIS